MSGASNIVTKCTEIFQNELSLSILLVLVHVGGTSASADVFMPVCLRSLETSSPLHNQRECSCSQLTPLTVYRSEGGRKRAQTSVPLMLTHK